MFGERVARWAEEEEEAGMDVGIACLLPLESSGGSASSAGCETRRARVCALAHAAAVLTVRVVQIDSSRPNRRGGEQRAARQRRRQRSRQPSIPCPCPMPTYYLPTVLTPARTHTHTLTHDTYIGLLQYCMCLQNPLPPSSRPMWLSRAALYRCKYAHAQCVTPKT